MTQDIYDLEQDISPLREQIDLIDNQLLSLISYRANLANQIGDIKSKYNAPIFKPDRERAIFRSLENKNKGPLSNADITNIWREIISSCRGLEGKLKIAFLGPNGTFSEQAMQSYFGKTSQGLPCLSIDDVFRTIDTEQVKHAVVPIENSTEGAVSRTLDLLIISPSKIIGEIIIGVNHNLLSTHSDFKKALNSAKAICAHPQALAQCQVFLNNTPQLKNLERRAVSSNALAAQMAAEDDSILAIASDYAANEYGIHIIKQYIQDEVNNRTRFIVLGNEYAERTGSDQTSIMLSINNETGAILKAISPFAKYNVSMSRLQSRPVKLSIEEQAKFTSNPNFNANNSWEYYFLIDIDGHIDDYSVKKALDEVKSNVKFFKCLGSYAKI
jgi:chorismate mutase / prephenate dehydratase